MHHEGTKDTKKEKEIGREEHGEQQENTEKEIETQVTSGTARVKLESLLSVFSVFSVVQSSGFARLRDLRVFVVSLFH
jgi:hypothetical protein